MHTKGGDSPIWNEDLEILNVQPNERLKLYCFDDDVGNDDLVGECTISVLDLAGKETWIDIEYKGK